MITSNEKDLAKKCSQYKGCVKARISIRQYSECINWAEISNVVPSHQSKLWVIFSFESFFDITPYSNTAGRKPSHVSCIKIGYVRPTMYSIVFLKLGLGWFADQPRLCFKQNNTVFERIRGRWRADALYWSVSMLRWELCAKKECCIVQFKTTKSWRELGRQW